MLKSYQAVKLDPLKTYFWNSKVIFYSTIFHLVVFLGVGIGVLEGGDREIIGYIVGAILVLLYYLVTIHLYCTFNTRGEAESIVFTDDGFSCNYITPRRKKGVMSVSYIHKSDYIVVISIIGCLAIKRINPDFTLFIRECHFNDLEYEEMISLIKENFTNIEVREREF